jgi:phosphatidate cytidylyltransferase
LTITAFLIAGVAVTELINGLHHIGVRASKAVALACLTFLYTAGGIMIASERALTLDFADLFMMWLFVSCASALFMILINEDHDIYGSAATLLCVVYIGYFSYHAVLLDRLPQGGAFIWLALIAAFCTDIFAFLVGTRFGKHKLSPSLSPHKSVEGALGGLAGSIACCAIVGYMMNPGLLLHSAIIGFVGSLAAQSGDLIASALKRKMQIKDFGTLIPGHGGVLDRFDSVMLALPAVYYYALLAIPS